MRNVDGMAWAILGGHRPAYAFTYAGTCVGGLHLALGVVNPILYSHTLASVIQVVSILSHAFDTSDYWNKLSLRQVGRATGARTKTLQSGLKGHSVLRM